MRALSSKPGFFGDLHGYDRGRFLDDLTAGAITAIMLVPQGMAYALLAGLPPRIGLYASIVPPAVYALAGSSRTLAVGPVAVVALMVAEALHGYGSGEAQSIAGAAILALEVGMLLLAAGALRLGRLVAFVSHPVLTGFTCAAAVLIILSQCGPLLGIHLPRGDAVEMASALVQHAGRYDPATLATSVAATVALLLGRRPLCRVLERAGLSRRGAGLVTRTAPLALVIVSSIVMARLAAGGAAPVDVVGRIPAGLPLPSLALFRADGWLELLPSAVLIALIGYVESVTVARVLGARRRERIEPNRELVAMGLANAGAALIGAMPVAGGFSRSVVNFDAGARTQLAALITAVLVAVVAAFFTSWFAFLPRAVLAAIIVVAVSQLIAVRESISIIRFDRADGITLLITFATVLGFGLEPGLIAGIGAALILYVWRTSRPHIAIIGRVPGTEHFRNVRRHKVEQHPDLMLVRIDENIYFANADAIHQFVLDAADAAPDAQHLVIVMTSVSYVDSSGVDLLEQLEDDLAARGIALCLAEVKGPVSDRLETIERLAPLLRERVYLSVDRAVCELTHTGPTLVGPLGGPRSVAAPDTRDALPWE